MEAQQIANRHKARAAAALEIGRYAVAETEARAALGVRPDDVDATLYLTRARLGLARFREAAEAARSAIGLAPRDAYAHYLAGFALHAAGKPVEAIEALRESVRLNPRAARYHARLAIALLDQRDLAGARACIETALGLEPDNAYLLDEAARVFGLIGTLPRAEDLAREVLRRTPASATAHWRLAWVLGLGRRFDEAAQSARAALRVDPNNWPAWEELGYALHQLGDARDAEGALREALRLRPGLHSATINLADLLWKRGAIESAERVCEQTLASDPSNGKVRQLRESLRAMRTQHRVVRRALQALLVVLLLASIMLFVAARGLEARFAVALVAVVLSALLVRVSRPTAEPSDDVPPPTP